MLGGLGLIQGGLPWSLQVVLEGLRLIWIRFLVGRCWVFVLLLSLLLRGHAAPAAASASAAALAALRGGGQHVVEAGQADVQQHAPLDVELVVEVVELLGDVVAQHDGEETGDVAFLRDQHIEAAATPRDVAGVFLCCQGHLGSTNETPEYQWEPVEFFITSSSM